MSAYIVGNNHISAMLQVTEPLYPGDSASYWYDDDRHYIAVHDEDVGQILVDENFRSVNHRYGESDPPDTFIYSPLRRYTMVEILKAIHCYEYQCCETEDWEETEAFAITQALKYWAICMLPGHDALQWNIVE